MCGIHHKLVVTHEIIIRSVERRRQQMLAWNQSAMGAAREPQTCLSDAMAGGGFGREACNGMGSPLSKALEDIVI